MGRKPLPDDQKKHRIELWVTDEEEQQMLLDLEHIRKGHKVYLMREFATGQPEMVKLPVMPLQDEAAEVAIAKHYGSRPAHNVPMIGVTDPPLPPSMRECSVCGKDYDGDAYDSCPHDHVANGKRK